MTKTILVTLLLSLLQGCGTPPESGRDVAQEIFNQQKKAVNTDSSRPSIDNVSPLKSADTLVVYSDVFSIIVHTDEDSVTLGVIEPTELLVYRGKTIKPQEIKSLSSSPKISEALIKSIESGDEVAETLAEEYGTLAPLKRFSGSDEPAQFFREASAKFPNAKVAVSVSKIGFENDCSKALVFVEYYHEEVGLRKFYVLLSRNRSPIGVDEDRSCRFDSFEIIPVG